MNTFRRFTVLVAVLALLSVAGSGIALAQEGAATSAEVIVLSNSSPHVSVIDTSTREVVRTTDIPDFTSWTWNDDNNHYDGQSLWLGLRDPDTNAVEVITLDLDTLEVGHRIDLGEDPMTLYMGKAAEDGTLHVGKMGSGQVVWVDTASGEVVKTVDVPVNGGVVCDIDYAIGPDGVARAYYPTKEGDTVVAIDADTGEELASISVPTGVQPFMGTIDPLGRPWMQELANTNAVHDPITLEIVARIPTGERPIGASFSPDGSLGYITHSQDTIVRVVDTATLEKVTDVQVGTNPTQVAVGPDGRFVYAMVTQEGLVGVIDTETWEVVDRIPLGTNPRGIFLRTVG
jgi:YVTN family beta-propeller protein